MRILVNLLFLFLFVGCSTDYKKMYSDISKEGEIETSISEFDGRKEVNMVPAWLYQLQENDSPISIGLFKSDSMHNNAIIFPEIEGLKQIKDITLNIDGKIIKIESQEKTDYYTGSKRSRKRKRRL